MGVKSFFLSKPSEKVISEEPSSVIYQDNRSGYSMNPIIEDVFDGEKTAGELGAVYDTLPDHLKLRLRAYDMNLKTDIIKIITGKFFKWVIGSGLKLQSEPNEIVLGLRNIKPEFPKLKKEVEALFKVYSDSKYSDYQDKDDLHQRASEAFETAFLGGDCLCVIRVNKYGPNIQVVDGQQIENPLDDTLKEEGNTIEKGIEINSKGQHIAFWVCQKGDNILSNHVRIKAKNNNGNLIAWMIYGSKARIDHHRGIPVISSILEKVSKLDRFVESSVTKAEQTANVVYAFQHEGESNGENILAESLGSRKKSNNSEESTYEKNGRTANMLRQSVSGTVMNLAKDSKLVSLSSDSESTFHEFFRAVFTTLCAAVDIPEEVALQKYEQSYSSSRAAINGWEHIVEIYRVRFSKKFYHPFYRVWFEHQVLSNQIALPSLIKAKFSGDFMALEAFYAARFTGKKMPHIDPLKEAKAMRVLLGDDTTPIINREQAAEIMGSGDWQENYKKFIEEQKLIPTENVKNKDNDPNSKLGVKTKA